MAVPISRLRSLSDRAICIFFVMTLFLPLAQQFFRLFSEPGGSAPQGLPSCLDVERRFMDRFPRQGLLSCYNNLRFSLFGLAPKTVVIGRDGWVFYRSESANDGHSMDAFMGLATIDKATLSSWRAILEEQVAWCRARGIAYLPVIAPNKEGIYPEFLPFAEQHLRAPRNRCDDFVAAISPVMPLGVMDLRPVLIQAKGEGQLYYKTDTHWTSLGAFLAVQAIHDRLHTAFPRLPRLERSDFVTRSKEFSGDIAAMAQLRDRYRETVDSLVPTRAFPAHSQAGTPVLGNDPAAAKADEPIGPNASGIAAVAENADSQLPTCILFCDSFGDGMVPYLEQCFRRFIHVRSSFDRAVVERERPDVVIQEFAERYLDRVAGDSH